MHHLPAPTKYLLLNIFPVSSFASFFNIKEAAYFLDQVKNSILTILEAIQSHIIQKNNIALICTGTDGTKQDSTSKIPRWVGINPGYRKKHFGSHFRNALIDNELICGRIVTRFLDSRDILREKQLSLKY